MKKQPAAIDINLVPKDPFLATSAGKALLWALTAGRYLLIFTIVIVIVSLGTRFAIDAQIVDLNNAVLSKEIRIRGFGELEHNVRTAQTKIKDYEAITSGTTLIDSFPQLTTITPFDVQLTSLSMRPEVVTIEGTSLSKESFNTYINNLQLSSHFKSVSISSLEANEETAGYVFVIKAETNAQPKPSVAPRTTPASGSQEMDI